MLLERADKNRAACSMRSTRLLRSMAWSYTPPQRFYVAEQVSYLVRNVFCGADGEHGNREFMLPGKNGAHAFVRCVEDIFAHFFLPKLKLDLEFSIADDELFGGRQADR